jgi:molecular chaperone GrpE
VTPEQIETVLAEFRAWLLDAGRLPDAVPEAEPVDLHTLVAHFTALRHEVNLQTRAVRQQQEQNTETLRKLEAATGQPAAGDEQLRPLLYALIDVADTQQRAAAELRRVVQTIAGIVEAETREAQRPPPSFWRRLFGAESAREPAISGKYLDRLRETAEAAVAGLDMGVQRIDRAMAKVGLEPIPSVGRPFDPETMEAVEVAAEGGPPGEVVAELRRGYRFNDRVLRFAQVRVAK